MPLLPILQICPGNPAPSTAILRTPAREVTDFSAPLHAIAADLLETLRHHGAAGIAAPQAGIPLRIAVVEQEGGRLFVLVNPRITAEAGPVSEGTEACLSLPGIRCVVRRPGALGVAYQDPAGVRHVLEARGLLSRIIAHEVDHLEGIPGPAGRPGSEGAGGVPGGWGPSGPSRERPGGGGGPSGRGPLHRPGDPGHGRGRALRSRAFTRRGRRTGGRRRSSGGRPGPSARRRRSA